MSFSSRGDPSERSNPQDLGNARCYLLPRCGRRQGTRDSAKMSDASVLPSGLPRSARLSKHARSAAWSSVCERPRASGERRSRCSISLGSRASRRTSTSEDAEEPACEQSTGKLFGHHRPARVEHSVAYRGERISWFSFFESFHQIIFRYHGSTLPKARRNARPCSRPPAAATMQPRPLQSPPP